MVIISIFEHMKLDSTYWEKRYKTDSTPWDMGSVSPPIKNWLSQQTNKNLKILIPGAGNAHEVEYAYSQGFTNVFLVDFALQPLLNFQKRCPNFPKEQILHQDFFAITESFDVMIEQTFFCALEPEKREDYAVKAIEILRPNGLLVGLLFDFPLTEDGPPFGGNSTIYTTLFENHFKRIQINPCKDSIKPRMGKELWIEMAKK